MGLSYILNKLLSKWVYQNKDDLLSKWADYIYTWHLIKWLVFGLINLNFFLCLLHKMFKSRHLFPITFWLLIYNDQKRDPLLNSWLLLKQVIFFKDLEFFFLIILVKYMDRLNTPSTPSLFIWRLIKKMVKNTDELLSKWASKNNAKNVLCKIHKIGSCNSTESNIQIVGQELGW